MLIQRGIRVRARAKWNYRVIYGALISLRKHVEFQVQRQSHGIDVTALQINQPAAQTRYAERDLMTVAFRSHARLAKWKFSSYLVHAPLGPFFCRRVAV